MSAAPSASKSKDAYTGAGVNISLADSLKSGIKDVAGQTRRPGVIGSIGGFGGLFELNLRKYRHPVLVSSIDGVGTKLKVAAAMRMHGNIGRDLVNHCVNDIVVLGAEPLYFLDYIGMGKLNPKVFKLVIGGIAAACAEAGCALIGGETAQMPGMYSQGDYDLVGCIVGVVDKSKIIDGAKIKPGDVIIGLASNGLHTNGYSLARQVLQVQMRARLDEYTSLLGCTFGEELLKVHRNYGPLIQKLLKLRSGRGRRGPIHGMAHITGGGFYDNIPRVLPAGCMAFIRHGAWPMPPIFRLLQEEGKISTDEMFRVFNMGIGMTLVVDADAADRVKQAADKAGIPAYLIGEIRKGKPRVEIV